MDDKQLKCFFKLAENCNYAQTARELFVTSSTVTRQIQSLEKELGLRLFDRTNTTVKLTPAGKKMVKKIRPLFLQTTYAISELKNSDVEEATTLRIGFHHLASVPMLPAAIKQYRSIFPGDSFFIQTGPPSSLNSRFYAGQLDVALGIRSALEERSSSGFFKLTKGVLCAILPVENPLSGRESLKLEELDGQTIFSLPQPDLPPYGMRVSNFIGLQCPHSRRYYVNSTDESMVLLRAGMGVAVALQYTYPPSTDYTMIPLDEPYLQTSDQDYCVLWRKGDDHIKAFIEILKGYISI